ncbi:MAG: hypothetical protein H7252_05505 [Cytophaga sp.]|nr:hypothetical protein [Undibacterium sp.]
MNTSMRWKKLGLVFCPSGEFEWMHSHAAVPIAESLGKNLFKIYFSSRDKDNKSFTCYVVIDIEHPNKLLDLSTKPVMVPGGLGEFDDSGAMGTWLTTYKGKDFLYYAGWNLGVTVPFRNSIGLYTRTNGGEFTRHSSGPIVDRSMYEPHFCGSCAVLPSEDFWRMWYLSCTGWQMRDGKPQHRYHLKYAESLDGVIWQRNGVVAIDFANEHEYAISRPSVIRDSDRWRMWYSFRGQSYRIGYAESDDGRQWTRLDSKAGIDVSATGWDSDMIEYPFVFDHGNQRYMLYNGNGYGITGFGLAVLEKH